MACNDSGRDGVFVPVGLAYDRVLEAHILTGAAQVGNRRFRGKPLTIIAFTLATLGRILLGRFKGFGTAAAAFGTPLSLAEFWVQHPDGTPEVLGQHLMAAIMRVVPVVPVALVATGLREGPTTREALAAILARLVAELTAVGAVLKLPPQGLAATLTEGLTPLIARGLVTADLRVVPGRQHVVDFYAASVLQRLAAA